MTRQTKFRIYDTKLKKCIKPTNKIKIRLDGKVTLKEKWADNTQKHWVVQHFTGLQDSAGRDIYEGDSVTLERESGGRFYRIDTTVEFRNGMFGIILKGFNDFFVALYDDQRFNHITILND